MQLKKKLIPISKPLSDIYEQREEIGDKELYTIVRPTDPDNVLAEFHVNDIPNLDESILSMYFLRSVRNPAKEHTIFYAQ